MIVFALLMKRMRYCVRNRPKRNSHCPGHVCEVNLAGFLVYWDSVYLDTEISSTLVKRGVGRNRHNATNMYKHEKRLTMFAVVTYISGSVIPLVALAQSRCVFTDIMIDSVPPEVVAPAPVGLLNILRHMATISASIFRTAGKTSG